MSKISYIMLGVCLATAVCALAGCASNADRQINASQNETGSGSDSILQNDNASTQSETDSDNGAENVDELGYPLPQKIPNATDEQPSQIPNYDGSASAQKA